MVAGDDVDERGGDLVGNVGDHAGDVPGPPDLQRIALEQGQSALGEFLSEHGPEVVARPAVQFHGGDLASGGEQGFGQHARTGADFEHVVLHVNLGPGHGPFDDVVVNQEVLTEGFVERLLGAEGVNKASSTLHASTGRRSSIRRGTRVLSSISSTKR